MFAGRFQVKTIRCKHLYSQVLEETMYLKLNSRLRSNTISSKVLKVLFMLCVFARTVYTCVTCVQCPWRPENGIRSPRTKVTQGC